jgi:hypothetical protein
MATATVIPAALASPAWATQTVHLHATLTPERLGQSTTIGFGFNITAPRDRIPPPLTGLQISYPVDLAFALSELGLARCPPTALEIFGIEACPADSLMGYGTATAEIAFGPEIIHETAQIAIVRTTDQDGHIALLIYAEGTTPTSTQVIFPALILSAPPPYGGRLAINLPLLEVLPGAPDVAIIQFRSTLGPLHLRYHEFVHGDRIEYEPKGVPLPETCPHGGFQFAARLTFQDGSQSDAHTSVPCPGVSG